MPPWTQALAICALPASGGLSSWAASFIVLRLGLETRIRAQVSYLGGDPEKRVLGSREVRCQRKGSQDRVRQWTTRAQSH